MADNDQFMRTIEAVDASMLDSERSPQTHKVCANTAMSADTKSH